MATAEQVTRERPGHLALSVSPVLKGSRRPREAGAPRWLGPGLLEEHHGLVVPARDGQHPIDAMSQLGVREAETQHEHDHEVHEVDGVGPRTQACDADGLGGDPGDTGEEHVGEKGPVRQATSASAGRVDDPCRQEVARAGDQHGGEQVAHELYRVAHRQRVRPPEGDQEGHHARDGRQAEESKEHGAVRPGPEPSRGAGGELAVGEDLGGGVSQRPPEKTPFGPQQRLPVPRAPGPPGPSGHHRERPQREQAEDGDEGRVGDHPGINERSAPGAERAAGSDENGEERRHRHVRDPEEPLAVDDTGERPRAGVTVGGELPERTHDARRLGARRAPGRALRAPVAVPDVLVRLELVLQAEADEGYLATWEEALVIGEVARRRARAALQAGLQGLDVEAVGPEERPVAAARGEVPRPVRQRADRPAVKAPTEVTGTGLRDGRALRAH